MAFAPGPTSAVVNAIVVFIQPSEVDAYAPDLQDWGPLVVPPDSFFALGDNRDASYDSRYYGFIPMSRVLGKPRVIYLSLEKDTSGSVTGLRWARIGARVR